MKAQDSDTGYVPKSETDVNILSMMGASPTATHIAGLIGQCKLESAEVTKLLANAEEHVQLVSTPHLLQKQQRHVHLDGVSDQRGEKEG